MAGLVTTLLARAATTAWDYGEHFGTACGSGGPKREQHDFSRRHVRAIDDGGGGGSTPH